MKYNGAVVTSNGSSFLSGLVANKKSAVLDKIIILNTDVPSNKTIDSMTAQDFSNGMSFYVNNVSQNDNSFTATSVVSNTGNENNYPAMLVGLFGYYDGSSERTLLSVSKAVDPFVIEKDTGTPVKLSVSITVGFSNSQQINLTVKDDVYLAKKDLDGAMLTLGYAKQSDIFRLEGDIATAKASTDSTVNQINANLNNVNNTANDAYTLASKAKTTADQAQSTAYSGLRFMGDIQSDYLYLVQTPGIYNLAGRKYIDWKDQNLWGNFVVIDAGGGVVQQFIYNNTNNCWVQTCNSWGNTGFKSIY
ncbi:hypothetical protein ACOMA7_00785 [Apilactobacillus sp. 1-1-2]|uniref:hypothetical protein n=1 Tax=Apilactobacillus sp. 1-1-2 TaxID=3411035 RepID=UPI003B94CB40